MTCIHVYAAFTTIFIDIPRREKSNSNTEQWKCTTASDTFTNHTLLVLGRMN